MKKFTLILTLLSAFLFSFSQNNNITPPVPVEQSKYSLGFSGGFGHSFLTPYMNYALNPSWSVGVFAVYSPWVHWGIGADILHSSEGATFKSGDLSYTRTFEYMRIPLKAIYYFNKYENDFRPKISLGPTLGFLSNQDEGSNAANFDFGANLSAGFNYRLIRAVWFAADISYYQGFLDVNPGNGYCDLNGNVRLNLGLSFGF